MISRYKILHVEDVRTDAELVARELQINGVHTDITVVDTQGGYEQALATKPFDIILCDHLIPGFNSFKALDILKQRKLDIPFIVVTATMTEDVAIAMVRNGADDYIIKDRLKRLPHAVMNAVEKFRHEKDRKRLVDNLYEKETLSKELLTQLSSKILLATKVAGIGIWEFNFHEMKLIADDVLLLQFDTTPGRFDGDHKSLLSTVLPEDREALVGKLRMHIQAGTEFTVDYRIVWPDGSLHYMKTIGVVELDILGDPYRIIGSNQDVTADKLAEQKIKESEARMAQAQSMAKVGSWETDLLTLDVVWSAETCRIFDLENCNEETTHANFLKYVHPEDKISVDESFSNSMRKTGHNSMEHRIITESGQLKHVEECWRFVYNEKGEATKAVGTVQDITVSKKASLLVLESEARYRSLIESSMDAILLASGTGDILAANIAACILFKMSEKELLASKREMIVDSNDPRFKSFMQERITSGRARGEHTLIRKDKSVFPGEVSSVLFLNADGEERISVTIRDVTDRKKAEKELLETSNELCEALSGLNKIMDSSVDVICAVDASGHFTKVSAACKRVWDYNPEELIGKRVEEFIYQEDVDPALAKANEVRGGLTVTHFENRYIKKDGSPVSMEWTARWDEKEEVMYGVGRDVTEKKRLQKAFEIERTRFENLYFHAPSCMGILKGPEHIYEVANPLYLQLIGRTNIIGKSLKEVLPGHEEQGLFEILDNVYKTGITFSANERLVRYDTMGIGILADKYLNFIYQAHRDINNEIDGILFFAVDVTEQVLSRKVVEESQKRYRQIVQTAQEGIWLIDENEVTTFVNDKMCEMFEYSTEEMLGKDIYFFMDEEGQRIARDSMEKKKAGESGQQYYKYLSKSKKEIWANVSANPLFDDAGVYHGALGMLTDVTELKKAQDLIRESEERYRNLFKQNLAGFYQSTIDGKIINCNDAFAKMLKYDSTEDVMSVNASAFYFTEGERQQFVANVIDRKDLHNYEGILKCKDGTALFFLENISVHTNPENGIVSFDGIMIDISEKKADELKLKESNERFVNVGKATFDIIWDWDIETGVLNPGERYDEVFGYATENKKVERDAWSNHIHFEDRDKVLDSIAKIIEEPNGSIWTGEYRYLCADGRIKHIADKGILLVNKQGQRRMIGAMQDITEKKALENLLRKASSLAAIGSWEMDLIEKTVYWSDVVKEILEVDADFEPTFESALNFSRNAEDQNLFIETMRNATQNGRSWDVEINIDTKGGKKKWIRIIGEAEYVGERFIKVYGSLQDIDQRKLSGLAITNAFNEKNTILESIGDAFFALDHDWTFTYWNKQAEEILKRTKSETIGNKLWDVFPGSLNSISHSKYQEAIDKHESMHFEDHNPELNEWYEISAYPSDNGLSVYLKDITSRKITDEAVRASEEIRKLIMDAAMDAIICINSDGFITVWNPQAEKTFGWSEKAIMGKLLADVIIPHRLREGHTQGMVKYHKTGHGPLLRRTIETLAIDSAGKEFSIELSVLPIKQGSTEFFCAFIRDISSRKIAEEKMSELHENLLEQSKKLMISNEELEKYAYVTSHDLQEPLRMVTSFLQLLQKKYEGQLDETAQKYINFAVDGAGRMKTLILDLLEFSRISSTEQVHGVVSLNETVSRTILGLKTSIDETQAIIHVPELPEVYGNELQFLQLFQNLISNAIKYRGIETPVIEIGFEEDDMFWTFSVKDNGIGIDPQFFKKIFIIFQRLHNKKNYVGTGIGLAICKKIIELHDGRIWVESIGNGSTFYFTLSKRIRTRKSVPNLN